MQKKVWLNKNSQEDLLYNFSLTMGDTFTFKQVSFKVIIDDTINTCAGPRRRIKFDSISGQWSKPRPFECIEGIGSLFNPFDLFFRGIPYDQCQNFLICSHQNNFVTYDSSYISWDTTLFCPETCMNTSYKKDDINKENIYFKIYPNPFTSQTVIQSDNYLYNATIIMENIFGQTVSQLKNLSGKSFSLQRDNLQSGIYFIRMTEDNKLILSNKIVIIE